MLILNINYIIYEFTYGLNVFVISWTKNLYVMLILNVDYIIYEFTYRLNPYVIFWMQICM